MAFICKSRLIYLFRTARSAKPGFGCRFWKRFFFITKNITKNDIKAKEEPEIIETNNSGRVKRTSMKKATENISASLVVRKPVSSKKNAGPKRGTSCMSTEYIVHSNIVDERNELAGNQEEETVFISPQPNNTEQTTEMAHEKGELG